MIDTPDWHDRAACRDKPTSMFFPPSDESGNNATFWDPRPGLAICAICPVRDECEAEHGDEEYGIWFGQMKNSRGGVSQVYNLKCVVCSKPFTSVASHSKYCTMSCRVVTERRQQRFRRAQARSTAA